MRKGPGKEAKMSFSAHALMENRNGLVVDFSVDLATGTAERDVAQRFVEEHLSQRSNATLTADSNYDTKDFVRHCRDQGVTPHVTQWGKRAGPKSRRRSAIDGRTTRHVGYPISQVVRRKIEEIFGWLKTFGGVARSKYRGIARTELYAKFAVATFNILKISKLIAK